jgi:KDO2-lipid IV(A) lauroyltransferase
MGKKARSIPSRVGAQYAPTVANRSSDKVPNTLQSRSIRFLFWLASLLPIGCSRAVGRGIGHIGWALNASYCGVTRRNLELAYPQMPADERVALAKRSILATGETAAEMGYVWARPWSDVNGLIVEVCGVEAVREALASGRGVMVLGPHLGNWEVAGLYMATLGEAVTLYEPPHMKALDNMVRQARSRSGATLVPTDKRGLAMLVRSLRGGGIAAILPDQVPPVVESGENSIFMGIPCFTATLASKLLTRSGAVAFFSFAERVDDGFRVHYLPAEEALYSDDIDIALKAMNDGVERCLRHCPEQYQWEYKRFRTRPREEPDQYANI